MSTNPDAASAKQTTTEKVYEAAEDLGGNPVALLVGGIALGVLIGSLLPRLAKERELLDPVGRKLAERASAAAQAAKEAGRQEIDALLPNKDDTKERVTALFGNVIGAAKDAAKA